MRFFKQHIYVISSVLILGGIYLVTAPSTVQLGDTGELVTNGYYGRVSHPPGYPLFTTLMFFFTNLVNLGTIFFRASLFQITLSIFVLLILWKAADQEKKYVWTMIVSSGLGLLYWKYSLLPDVFMLNLFFATLISYVYFKDSHFLKLCCLFGLALTNHLTIIFLSPLLCHSFLNCKGWKKRFLGFFLILAIAIIGHSLLFLFDSKSFGSWGSITTIEELIAHLLRKDYGIFTLSNSGEKSGFLLENLWQFSVFLIKDYFFILAIFVSFFYKVQRGRGLFIKEKIYFLSFLFYILVFFTLANLIPRGANIEIVSRFYLLPLGMLIVLALRLIGFITDKKTLVIISSIALINLASNLYRNYVHNNFCQDTYLQQLYEFILKKLPLNAVYIVTGDTQYFALYYLQEIAGIRKDVTVVSPMMYHFPWYRKKLQQRYPAKDFSNGDINSNAIEVKVDNLIIAPNIKKYQIFIDSYLIKMVNFEHYDFIHRGLFMEVIPRSIGVVFRCDLDVPKPPIKSYKDYDMNLEAYTWAGACDFLLSVHHFSNKKIEAALIFIESAIEKVPYSVQYQEFKCKLLGELNQKITQDECKESLKLKEHNYHYIYSEF